jgi:methyl-accepting chemotaxis protein
MSTNKIDVSTVYEMFEEINKRLDKQTAEPIQIDFTAINTMTERFEDVIREVRKPAKVEHRHKIDIASNWFFLSWVALVIIILGSFWGIANQRQTINQYKDNDLKYRYIKMKGQTNEENLYRLERQFKYNDSIKIIRKQVEKYEELVKEQIEKLERVKRNSEEAEKLKNEVESLKKLHK